MMFMMLIQLYIYIYICVYDGDGDGGGRVAKLLLLLQTLLLAVRAVTDTASVLSLAIGVYSRATSQLQYAHDVALRAFVLQLTINVPNQNIRREFSRKVFLGMDAQKV